MPHVRKVRFTLLATIAAALAVFIGAVTVRLFFPASKAAALLERELETRTGQDIRFRAARFDGLSTIRLESVELGGVGTARSLSVRARLVPLILGRLSITDVDLDGPQLTFTRRSPAARFLPPAILADGGRLFLANVRIRGGAVSLVDVSSPTANARVDALDLTLHNVSSDEPVSVSGSGRLTWRGAELDASFTGTADIRTATVRVTRATVAKAEARAKFEGRFDVGETTAPACDGRLSWEAVDPSSFTAIVTLPDGLSVRGPTSGEVSFDRSGTRLKARLKLDATAAGAEWKDMVAKAPGTTMRIDTDVERDGDRTALRGLTVRLASIDLSGDGDVRGSTGAARIASLRLKTSEFDIEDLFRHLRIDMANGVVLRGAATATISVEGWTGGGEFVTNVDATKLEAGYRRIFQKPAGIGLKLLASGRYATPVAVDLSSLRLDVNGVELSGRGSYTPGKERPTYTFRLKSDVFPLEAAGAVTPLIQPFAPTGRGVLSFRVTRGEKGPALAGNLTLVSAGGMLGGSKLSALSGTVRFTDDALSTSLVTGRIDGSPLRFELSAHRYAARPFVNADIRVDELDLNRLFSFQRDGATYAPFDTGGTLRAGHIEHRDFSADDATLEWDLAGVGNGLSSAEGTLVWRQGPGRFGAGVDLLLASDATRVLLLPGTVARRIAGGDASFEAIDSDVEIKKGDVTVSPYLLQAGDRAEEVRGAFDLAGQDLDLDVQLRSGTARRDLQISGPFTAPAVSPKKH